MGQERRRQRPRAANPRFDWAQYFASLESGVSTRIVRPNHFLYRQGDPADALFYVKAGKIQVSVLSQHGKHRIIAMLGAGEFAGETALAGQTRQIASAIAMEEAVVIRIEKDTMLRVLNEDKGIFANFLNFLLARNMQIQADLVDHLFNSSERRLARVLLLLANFGKNGDFDVEIPKLSQDVLAARVGTTRARVSYFMNKFRKMGFIDYNGGLKIHAGLLNVVIRDE